MVTGNDESKMSELEDTQQQQQQDQEQDQQQQKLESESGSEEDSDPCPAGGALSSKFDRTDTSINTNPLPYGKYTLIGIDIDTTGRRLIDEIVQISAYTPDHQHSQYIMPLMNLNPAARQRHQVRVITVGFFRMLKSMQTYRVVKTKTEISALNEFIGWLEQRAREDPGSDGIVLIYHEQRKFVPYMLIEALKKYNLLDRFAQTVRSFANGFKLAEEKCSKTIKYFSIRQLAKLVLDESEAKDGFEGNAAYRARLAYQIARRLSNDNKESPSGETSQDESSAVAKSDNEAESEDAAAATEATEAADADAAPVAPVSTGAIPKASRDMGNYTASPSDENVKDGQQPQQQQEDPEEDDHSGTDVDVVTGHVTTIPEPQPRSRPTTEAEREKMCAVLCELASPITCEISELDEQEVILVRQNSLRPVFLQYFKTTIYHRVKAVTYRRVLAEYGHDFASLHQIWTETKREGLEHVTAKIVELKDDERAELVELLDCHYDPDKQQLKPIVKRIRPRSNRGPGRPFFGNKNNNSANGVGNPNNTNNNNKENRKPMGGRNSAGNNNNNGTFYANNSNINNNNNNNNGKHNNNNQPPSPNGNGNGAGAKKFRQRQPRRRRSNQNNKSDAPQNFQNQPQMIQTNA